MNKSFYRQRHIDNPQASEELQMARKEQAAVDAALEASEASTLAIAKSRTVRWTARSGQEIEVTVWSRNSIKFPLMAMRMKLLTVSPLSPQQARPQQRPLVLLRYSELSASRLPTKQPLKQSFKKGFLMMSLQKVLKSLGADTVIENGITGEINTVGRELAAIEGSNDAAEPAVIQGQEIYLATENGEIYTAATPAYRVKHGR